MRKNILFLLMTVVAVAGCSSKGVPVADDAPVDNVAVIECVNCGGANVVHYSMPNGNDLKLETAHHIIDIQAQPGKQYDYYIWTGDKQYNSDPDMIVQDGVAAVLVEEK